MEKAQRTSKEASNAHGFTVFADSDLQERDQTIWSFSEFFTTEQLSQNIEAHKISP